MADAFKSGFPTTNGMLPVGAPRALPIPLDFTSVNSLTFNLFAELAAYQIDIIQAVYIDNGSNTEPLALVVTGTQQRIICPPQSQGYFPLLYSGDANITVSKTTVGGAGQIILLNMPFPAMVWAAVSTGGGGGGTLPAGLTGSTYTSAHVILTGGADVLWGANAARKRIVVTSRDTNTGPVYLQIGSNVSMTIRGLVIFPGGSYITPGGITECPQAIYVQGNAADIVGTWQM